MSFGSESGKWMIGDQTLDGSYVSVHHGKTHILGGRHNDWVMSHFENLKSSDLPLLVDFSISILFPGDVEHTEIIIHKDSESTIEYVRTFDFRKWKSIWNLDRFLRVYRDQSKSKKDIIEAYEQCSDPETPYVSVSFKAMLHEHESVASKIRFLRDVENQCFDETMDAMTKIRVEQANDSVISIGNYEAGPLKVNIPKIIQNILQWVNHKKR